MRLFIAINFDDEKKDRITEIQNKLKEQGITGNYSKRDNLHLTLVFIGEIAENKISDIIQSINMINIKAFDFELMGISYFKGNYKGDTVFLDVLGNQHLNSINKFLIYDLKSKGFILKERDFKPHLTLIREAVQLKDSLINNSIKNTLDLNIKYDKISVKVDKISLMVSERKGNALIYREIYFKNLLSDKLL
jgi:2'-5' RNA ligase